MKTHIHPHPRQFTDRVSQFVALGAIIVLLISIPFQIFFGLAGGGLFFMSAFFSGLMILPLLMATVITPAIQVDGDGLTLMPIIWKPHHVAWSDIRAVKHYPLLPPADAEITRKIAIGKAKYAPANGVMLVIPKLPWMYRIGGFFAGEKRQPIIAITNRAHSRYDELVYAILEHTDPAIHADDIKQAK